MLEAINKAKFRYIDSSKYDSDWHSTLHSHAFTELFYVLKGKGQFQFGESEFIDVEEDDLIMINNNTLHTEFSDLHEPLEYIVIGVEGIEFFGEFEHIEYLIHNYNDNKHEILFYFRAIFEEMSLNDKFTPTMLDHLLKVLLMNIVRNTNTELTIFQEDPTLNKDCVFIENYINHHYKENITLDKLSDLTFLNKYYLSHEFKKYSGKSPIDFLLDKRISEAKKLLSSTDLSISSISSNVGFGNSSYFSQYFKKSVGISPSEYRIKHKYTAE